MWKDIECPYCGKEQDICHDDGYGFEEGVMHEQECEYCGKRFGYYTSIIYDYEAKKCSCLNGGKHKWKLSNTFPKKYSKMVCSECEEERDLTEEEKIKYNIK